MAADLAKSIYELSFRMRLLRAIQQEQSLAEDLSEREIIILGLLKTRGGMAVSQIACAYPCVSESTISTTITRLWREKLVSKTISPENQRTTIVDLTDKGRVAIELINMQRTERFKVLFEAIDVTGDEKQIMLKVLARAIKFFDKHLGLSEESKGELL